MTNNRLAQKTLALSLAGISILMTACQPMQKGLDAEDDRNPYFRRATKLAAEQDFHGAIKEYEGALRANPEVARAHVEMGLLYLDKLGDPVSAIYHFQQYLGDRPSAPDQEQLETYIDKAKIDFAITLPNSTAQNAEEYARLKNESVELRQTLAETQAALAKARDQLSRAGMEVPALVPTGNSGNLTAILSEDADSVAAAAENEASSQATTVENATPPRAEPVLNPIEGDRTHTIVKGDSLWKIASTYYPDNVPAGVKKIQEANPEKAANPANLKLGDELIIP